MFAWKAYVAHPRHATGGPWARPSGIAGPRQHSPNFDIPWRGVASPVCPPARLTAEVGTGPSAGAARELGEPGERAASGCFAALDPHTPADGPSFLLPSRLVLPALALGLPLGPDEPAASRPSQLRPPRLLLTEAPFIRCIA